MVAKEHEPCEDIRLKMESQIKALTTANTRLKSHAEQTEAAMVTAVKEKEKLQDEFNGKSLLLSSSLVLILMFTQIRTVNMSMMLTLILSPLIS